jgi:SAM-dependent methyltransferase
MSPESIRSLDPETLGLFARKGLRPGCDVPHTGNENGVKVRRVMQIIRDLSKKPFERLRILDLACGEGVYAIEAALRGAEVIAVDARSERMDEGAAAAARLGLRNLKFEKNDVRRITAASHGRFDVVLFLGILYHLEDRDAFSALRNIHEMCEQFVIIDTHIALRGRDRTEGNGKAYDGARLREHAESDPETLRASRLQASLDNLTSFWFTKESLFRLLGDVGFTSAGEFAIPREPLKPKNRITLVATKGDPVRISSYPWVNDKTEDEICVILGAPPPTSSRRRSGRGFGAAQFAKTAIKRTLRRLGFEIRRI